MALSDDLAKLATRAKEAEDRFAAAQKAALDKVQHDVQSARESLEQRTDQLRQHAETNKGKVAAWWSDVQRSWDDQIASIRRDIESKKAEHDVKAARRRADSAEEDAEFAIQYAYWAVEDAEYAVLDATLGAHGCRQSGRIRRLARVRTRSAGGRPVNGKPTADVAWCTSADSCTRDLVS